MNHHHLATLRSLMVVSDDEEDEPTVAEESLQAKGERLLGGLLAF